MTTDRSVNGDLGSADPDGSRLPGSGLVLAPVMPGDVPSCGGSCSPRRYASDGEMKRLRRAGRSTTRPSSGTPCWSTGVIDPAADNQPAIRCYTAVGFRPVGIMRRYERNADGSGWHDGLLMDLLADELT